ncbi:Protein CBR-MRPL-34 [Dirofilaria immitis]|nr:Protein CBR-MRPL-34 [Dirofilaria immitis]
MHCYLQWFVVPSPIYGDCLNIEEKPYVYYHDQKYCQLYLSEKLVCAHISWLLRLKQSENSAMPSKPRVDRIKICYTAAMQLNYGWRMSGYPFTPFNNAVTKYIPQLHRITLRFCRKNECSSGIRQFIDSGQNIPVLRAEYGNGRIIQIVLKNFGIEQVEKHFNLLRTRTGLPVIDLISRQSAQVASVQGMWNPMLNTSSELNISELLEKKFSRHRTAKLSATEYVSLLVDENISDSR